MSSLFLFFPFSHQLIHRDCASLGVPFDPRSWVEIKPLPTKRFSGFTYNTPKPEEVLPAPSLATDCHPGARGVSHHRERVDLLRREVGHGRTGNDSWYSNPNK